jgi:two-component system cell cycle response regulator DivK
VSVALPPSVLLITDSPDERDMYADALRRCGFSTVQAQTAAEGYRLACERPPAAIVTDVRLAGPEDGLSLTRRLKRNEHMRRIPVVILTGYVFTHDREAAARAGCDLFVPKPCLPDALSQVVTGLIERRS